ncbi:hypothetical protein GGR41_002191 [Paenalcaligenes hominis]|uniref:Uncharacterized protein n=1 Tax=Paenalcaligenes hominis TaxID=643674 RepID=A0ABX0WT70_9BURK|nr:hypothetical protein [Paenalcaligenes hominis]NJB65936.1 hypothetical protein [Paenalcaligenes hominis]GGE70856.1 hypothetical protein GCM10007278_18720 [Paenalcaligenes hominis]
MAISADTIMLVADDFGVAQTMMGRALEAFNEQAKAEGKTNYGKVSLAFFVGGKKFAGMLSC